MRIPCSLLGGSSNGGSSSWATGIADKDADVTPGLLVDETTLANSTRFHYHTI
jgi:hypothetical protein